MMQQHEVFRQNETQQVITNFVQENFEQIFSEGGWHEFESYFKYLYWKMATTHGPCSWHSFENNARLPDLPRDFNRLFKPSPERIG